MYTFFLHYRRRAAELTKEQNASILDTLAYAYFKHGDVQNVLKYQKMAVELAEKDSILSFRAEGEEPPSLHYNVTCPKNSGSFPLQLM
jgi:hypothetical protein